jgi:ubiquinone/menaquinone biosynthesis C-methylase UbiE
MVMSHCAFKVRSIRVGMMGRTVGEYESILKFKASEIIGDTVLDIGSGYGRFLEDAAQMGIFAIGIDPQCRNLQFTSGTHYINNQLRAVGEALPFKNNSFQKVLCCMSSFSHLDWLYPDIDSRKEAGKRMLDEAIRVLKRKGEVRIADISAQNASLLESALAGLVRKHAIGWEFSKERNNILLIIQKC